MITSAFTLQVAVKTFEPAKYQEGECAYRERELEVLRLLMDGDGHPHIAGMIAEHTTPYASYSVMLYCGVTSLARQLQKLRVKQQAMGEGEAALVTAQVVIITTIIVN